MDEKVDIQDGVGFRIVKPDGTVIENGVTLPPAEAVADGPVAPPPVETPEAQSENPLANYKLEYEDVTMTVKLYKPIADYIANQATRIKDATKEDIYASLIHDGFRMHYNKMCPHCAVDKLQWDKERKRQAEITKQIQKLKKKRLRKMQKEARKANRGR